MSRNPGPPPVGGPGNVPESRVPVPMQNYLTIVDTVRANNSTEAKAIRAMFGGDKQLADRFLAVAFSALASRSDLLNDAEPMSLLQAIKDCASLGLEPLSQDATIVVYNKQAKVLVQWRGYVKRIRNSREVTDLDCQIVYEADEFHMQLGTDPSLFHVPFVPEKGYTPESVATADPDEAEAQTRGSYRGAYSWALMPSGKYIIEWMTADDINYVRDRWGNKRSSTGQPMPWETSWGEMARKTVIRRLAKRLPAAAVDRLLQVEQQHDEAAEILRAEIIKQRDDLADVRNIALRAVGAVPQLPAGEPAAEASGDSDGGDDTAGGGEDDGGTAPVPSAPAPEAGGPAAAAEPDEEKELVAAAMKLSDEQARLDAYRRGNQRGR